MDEGVRLGDQGIEFLGPFWMGRMSVSYANVESVATLPYHKGFFKTLFLVYGLGVRWMPTRLTPELAVIKLRSPPCFYRYVIFTPEDAAGFEKELNARIQKVKGVRP
jgi:hypothetical protein